MPHARDLTGDLVSVDPNPDGIPFTVQIVSFNNPDAFNYVRWLWQDAIIEKVPVDFQCTPENGEPVGPDGQLLCIWYVDMTLYPDLSPVGMNELRINANIPINEFGKRHFPSLNFQIWTAHSGTYRDVLWSIGRGWYEGPGYANARINYADFFNGVADLDRTIPLVSGPVALKIRHEQGSGGPKKVRSTLWLNANFHEYPEFHENAVVGVPHSSGAELLYEMSGNGDVTYMWDTTGLANGIHTLFAQTEETGSAGTNAGGLKVQFEVYNPNHDVAVTAMDAPDWVTVGQPVTVSVDITNQGISDETNILVDLEVEDPPAIDMIFVSLTAGSTTTVPLGWTPTNADIGDRNLTATAHLADENIANNSRTMLVTVNEEGATRPAPVVAACSPNSGNGGERVTVEVTGSNFQDGATADFGEGINQQSIVWFDSGRVAVRIKIFQQRKNQPTIDGPRDVTITNPDGKSGTGVGCFMVN